MTDENTTVAPIVTSNPDEVWGSDIGELHTADATEDVVEDEGSEPEEVDSEDSEEVESEESSEEEESEEESEEEEKVSVKETVESKKYKATKSDGTQLEIDSDTTFKIKVNGKFEKVAFQDLTKDYNGKVYYEERVRRASEKELQATKLLETKQAQEDKFNRRLKDLTSGITEGNVLDALADIGELVGEDPQKFRADMIESMSGFIQKWVNMTAEQQEKFLLEQKYVGLEKKVKQEQEDKAKFESKTKVEQAIEEASVKYKLERKDLTAAYEVLVENYNKQGISLDKLTFNDVVDLSLGARVSSNLKQAQEESGMKLDYEQYNKLSKIVFEQEKAGGADLELSDYIAIIKEVVGKPVKVKGSQGLAKKVPAERKFAPKKADTESFEDLNDIWG